LGNRIAILEGGRMIQCGTPAEIYTNPATQYVADFVANMNPLAVLTARDAVVQGAWPPPAASVPPEMPLRQVLAQLGSGTHPLGVRDGDTLLGCITPESALKALGPRT